MLLGCSPEHVASTYHKPEHVSSTYHVALTIQSLGFLIGFPEDIKIIIIAIIAIIIIIIVVVVVVIIVIVILACPDACCESGQTSGFCRIV